ncbi:MAG: HDIG domain-containing protein, partial [Eubacterium sp.]|nr:HDIG domain-containing protein [Eubacterium sp.]
MDRVDIIKSLQSELKLICEKPQNKFGMGLYDHIVAVVKNGEFLAKQYGADKEIVSIASWLHDIASATDYSLYKNHHIHGAEIAYDILTKFNYDEDKILLVQNC